MRCIFWIILLLSINLYPQECSNFLILDTKTEPDSAFEYKEYYGYKDTCENLIIPYNDFLICFTDTLRYFAFVNDRKEGLIAIDKKGNKLFNVFNFDNGPDYIQDGLFRIVKDDKIGFANTKGEVVIEPQFECVFPFSEGLAAFCEGCHREMDGEYSYWTGGKWGFIDKKGEVAIKPEYDVVFQTFVNGKAYVENSEEKFYINKHGERIE